MALSIRDVAEDAFAFIEHPSVEMERGPEIVLRNLDNPHPFFGLALRPRLRGEVGAAIAGARAWFAKRGREEFVWLVSDASEPADLVEQLLAAGAVPDPEDPIYVGMALTRQPEAVDGVDVRKIANFEDYAAAAEIMWQAFNFSEQTKSESRLRLREEYLRDRSYPAGDYFVALVDDRVVGSATSNYLSCAAFLLGGNVAPDARGRGVYRALIRARWDAAVERGCPALVVQAGKMSKPILERLGFQTLCTVHALLDKTSQLEPR